MKFTSEINLMYKIKSSSENIHSSHSFWENRTRLVNMNTTKVFDLIVPEVLQYSVSHLEKKHYSNLTPDRLF